MRSSGPTDREIRDPASRSRPTREAFESVYDPLPDSSARLAEQYSWTRRSRRHLVRAGAPPARHRCLPALHRLVTRHGRTMSGTAYSGTSCSAGSRACPDDDQPVLLPAHAASASRVTTYGGSRCRSRSDDYIPAYARGGARHVRRQVPQQADSAGVRVRRHVRRRRRPLGRGQGDRVRLRSGSGTATRELASTERRPPGHACRSEPVALCHGGFCLPGRCVRRAKFIT